MYTPPRAVAVPTAAVTRRGYLSFLGFLLFLIPLTLFVLTGQPAAAADICTNDTAGANDVSGQRDLTRLCSDTGALPSQLKIKWQWDQTGWSSGSTGRACSLFDTNSDGNANYALCVAVSGTPAAYQTQQLYQCNDARPEKCLGATPDPSTSVCTAGVQGTAAAPVDPFSGGRDYPRDTVGACAVNLSDIGGGTAQLIDVCSYSTQTPSSDPSDCVNYQHNTGRLEVRHVLSPSYNPGRFNLLIDGRVKASPVGDGGTTGEQIVPAGQHSVSVTTVPNTTLADYNTSVECRAANGTGAVVASQANNSPISLMVPDGSDIVCTITDERQTGIIYVTKVVDWQGSLPNQGQTFEICVYGISYPNGNCKTTDYDGGLLSWPGVETGDYDVVETNPGSAWSVVIDRSPVTVPCGGEVSATITNTLRSGSLEVTKFVNWNGTTPDPAKTFAICITGPSYGAPNCQNVDFDGGTLRWPKLIPGDYVVSEPDPGSNWLVTITSSPVTVHGGSPSAQASVTNTLQRDGLTVTKVADWNGITPDPGQSFTICIAGPSYPDGSCQNVGYLGGVLRWPDLLPGAYSVNEADAGPLWSTIVDGSPVTVGSDGGVGTATVVNTRKLGSLEVTKTVDWNGAPEDPSQTFQICITGPSYPSDNCQTVGSSGGTVLWGNLIPGSYVVSETDPGGMWAVQVPDGAIIVPGDGSGAQAAVLNKHRLGSLEVTKTVDWLHIPEDPNQTFQICITGPSYLAGNCQTVGPNGGVLFWGNLIPGPYVISETDPGIKWVAQVPDGPIIVPGDGKATATVVNTHRGSLEVTKFAIWNGLPEDPNQTFQVCITGPSYPNGNCQTVGSNGGKLFWGNLLPGSYIISEIDPGNMWDVEVPDGPIIIPGCDCGEARAAVFNTRKLGSLNVTKTVNWNGVTPDPNQAFSICITGPSFPDGDCQSIGAGGGELTWIDLIPGAYSVTENNPGGVWETVVTGSPAEVPADGGLASVAVTNTRLGSDGTGQGSGNRPGGESRLYLPAIGN